MIKRILGLIIILCGLGIGFFVIPSITGTASDIAAKMHNGNEKAVTEKMAYIAELSVVDYKYSNAVNYKSNKTINDLNIPFTKKEIVMTYDGDIKIGVDAEKITTDIEKGVGGNVKRVTVGLPKLKIISNEIDRDSIEFPKEKNNIFNSISTEDEGKIEETAKKEMAKNSKDAGVMDRAKKELKATMTEFLTALYGDDVEIEFTEIE